MTQKLPIVAITGRPNVGKSSLFNRLIGERRAIVEDVAGTTRDPVRSIAEWNKKRFFLIDTAGMQPPGSSSTSSESYGQLEADMQAQIAEATEAADVIVVVIDAGTVITEQDARAAKLALKSKKPVILAVNKIDTTHNQVPVEAVKLGIKPVIGVSAQHGSGSGDLLDAIVTHTPTVSDEIESDILTISLLGRPNVGKSSIVNKLVGERRAIVSEVAGTTRDVNKVRVRYYGKEYDVYDTAGIRRSGKIKDTEFFSLLRTTQAINEADICILIMDANEPSVAVDQKIAGMVKDAGKGLILAVNKWDQINQQEEAQKQIENLLHYDFQFTWWAPVVLTSALSGHNVNKLLKLSAEIAKRRQTEIKTKDLNDLLQQAISNHPPAGLKNRHPKLNYATQTGISPPTFTLFGAHLDFLHWSYKRYLETRLRENFDFIGTPIRLVFKSKYKSDQILNSKSQKLK